MIGSKWNKQWNIHNRLSIPEEALGNESYKAVNKKKKKILESSKRMQNLAFVSSRVIKL